MALPKISPDFIMRGGPQTFPTQSIGELIIEKLKSVSKVILIDAVTDAQVTTDALLSDVVTLAEELRARGFGPGSVIGFCSENRLEYPVTALAALAIGATCAPLNPLYTHGELKHTMSISQPSIVFCSQLTVQKLTSVQQELPFLRDISVFGTPSYTDLLQRRANPWTFKVEKIDSRNVVAALLCSSGTTGLPKCVELTHYNLVAFLTNLLDPRQEKEGINEHNFLGLIPFFHGYGFAFLLLTLLAPAKLVVMAKFDEKIFLEAIQKYKITFLALVPPLMVMLAKHPLVAKYDLSSLRTIRCGAAPLSKDIQLAVHKRLKIKDIAQGYGMTELSVACCFTPPEKNKMGSSGVITFGMEAKVVDLETGKALAPYKEGELCFKGPFIMKGYKNNPKATQETIDKDGWLHTGDIGYYDMDGFIYIVDRVKELIKYKGFQVPPAELEAILLKNPAIKDAAVIGIPDEQAGELPYAFVVLQPGAKLTTQEVQKFVAKQVSAQKRLSGGVRFVDEIPKNPSGKILRRELRNIYKQTKSKL